MFENFIEEQQKKKSVNSVLHFQSQGDCGSVEVTSILICEIILVMSCRCYLLLYFIEIKITFVTFSPVSQCDFLLTYFKEQLIMNVVFTVGITTI